MCPIRAVVVLEAGDADVHIGVPAVGCRHLLGVQLLLRMLSIRAVLVIGVDWDGVVLGQRRFARLHIAVDANRRGEEVAGDTHRRRRVGHVDVD